MFCVSVRYLSVLFLVFFEVRFVFLPSKLISKFQLSLIKKLILFPQKTGSLRFSDVCRGVEANEFAEKKLEDDLFTELIPFVARSV